jgi:glycosyltransferase involved in cell wall biosynthesis
MKILHIIPNLRKGGAERLVLDIVRELDKREDVEVRLTIFREEIEYDIDDIRHLIHIIPSGVQLSLWRKNKFNIENLQQFFDDFRPNIIHSHLFEAELVSRSCYYPKAKWFSHAHDNLIQLKYFFHKTLLNKKLFTNYLEKRYLLNRYHINRGTYFIAISKDAENYLKETVSRYNITLLNNAINYKRFYSDTKREINSSKSIKLINIGSFVPKKNQQLLLMIAEKLNAKNVNFEIHFLGDGKLKENLKKQSLALGLENRLFFHGNVNNVENYLWKSDLYIHVASYEPLGLVLIEAMAAGLPVITLDGKGNRDLINEGKNGYMIYEENPELFVDKILELWNDNDKYNKISEYAKEFASQFDIKSYIDKLLDVYKMQS